MEILPEAFYNQDTLTAARALLGCYLVRELDGEKLAVQITETEAYIGRMDKACHAYQYKRTPRTQTLFSRPGVAYIYLIYGMYHCLNFITEPEGEPCGVLIRGAVPVLGWDGMARRRFGCPADRLSPRQRRGLLDGPGKLCQGLALTRAENGLDLTAPPLYVCRGPAPPPEQIQTGPRIGVDYAQEAAAFPWRFWYGAGWPEEEYAVF